MSKSTETHRIDLGAFDLLDGVTIAVKGGDVIFDHTQEAQKGVDTRQMQTLAFDGGGDAEANGESAGRAERDEANVERVDAVAVEVEQEGDDEIEAGFGVQQLELDELVSDDSGEWGGVDSVIPERKTDLELEAERRAVESRVLESEAVREELYGTRIRRSPKAWRELAKKAMEIAWDASVIQRRAAERVAFVRRHLSYDELYAAERVLSKITRAYTVSHHLASWACMMERERGLDVGYPPMPMSGWPADNEGIERIKALFGVVQAGDSFVTAYQAVETSAFFADSAAKHAEALFSLLDDMEDKYGL